jgi:hypothetical protein
VVADDGAVGVPAFDGKLIRGSTGAFSDDSGEESVWEVATAFGIKPPWLLLHVFVSVERQCFCQTSDTAIQRFSGNTMPSASLDTSSAQSGIDRCLTPTGC